MTLLQNDSENLLYYFTGVYLLIDMEEKSVEYINAGHPAGYILIDEQKHYRLHIRAMQSALLRILKSRKRKFTLILPSKSSFIRMVF